MELILALFLWKIDLTSGGKGGEEGRFRGHFCNNIITEHEGCFRKLHGKILITTDLEISHTVHVYTSPTALLPEPDPRNTVLLFTIFS